MDRRDRVVYGWDVEGPLATTGLQTFDNKGYLTLDELLNPEALQECREELDRLANDPASKEDEATITDAESIEVRSIFNVHRTNAIFKKLANDPRIVRRMEQILVPKSISIRAESTTNPVSWERIFGGTRTLNHGMLKTGC